MTSKDELEKEIAEMEFDLEHDRNLISTMNTVLRNVPEEDQKEAKKSFREAKARVKALESKLKKAKKKLKDMQ